MKIVNMDNIRIAPREFPETPVRPRPPRKTTLGKIVKSRMIKPAQNPGIEWNNIVRITSPERHTHPALISMNEQSIVELVHHCLSAAQ